MDMKWSSDGDKIIRKWTLHLLFCLCPIEHNAVRNDKRHLGIKKNNKSLQREPGCQDFFSA
jgi:hypothetical protein